MNLLVIVPLSVTTLVKPIRASNRKPPGLPEAFFKPRCFSLRFRLLKS